MLELHDINTVPRDGTPVLVYAPDNPDGSKPYLMSTSNIATAVFKGRLGVVDGLLDFDSPVATMWAPLSSFKKDETTGRVIIYTADEFRPLNTLLNVLEARTTPDVIASFDPSDPEQERSANEITTKFNSAVRVVVSGKTFLLLYK